MIYLLFYLLPMAMDRSWLNGQALIPRVGAPQTWVWNWRRFRNRTCFGHTKSRAAKFIRKKFNLIWLMTSFSELSTHLPWKFPLDNFCIFLPCFKPSHRSCYVMRWLAWSEATFQECPSVLWSGNWFVVECIFQNEIGSPPHHQFFLGYHVWPAKDSIPWLHSTLNRRSLQPVDFTFKPWPLPHDWLSNGCSCRASSWWEDMAISSSCT